MGFVLSFGIPQSLFRNRKGLFELFQVKRLYQIATASCLNLSSFWTVIKIEIGFGSGRDLLDLKKSARGLQRIFDHLQETGIFLFCH